MVAFDKSADFAVQMSFFLQLCKHFAVQNFRTIAIVQNRKQQNTAILNIVYQLQYYTKCIHMSRLSKSTLHSNVHACSKHRYFDNINTTSRQSKWKLSTLAISSNKM